MSASVSAISSDLIPVTAAQTVVARPSRLSAVVAVSDGTNLCTVIVYDNAAGASGKVVGKAVATAQCPTAVIAFNNPIRTDNGLTVSVAGTNASGMIFYDA